jgi:uncharacterized membrane protein YbhN (UPF0104 family)
VTLRFALLLVVFAVLTAAGVWWAAPPRDELARIGHELADLGVLDVSLLVLLGLAAIGAEMIRLVVFGRLIDVRVTWRAALDASVANDLFSWISPGAILGEPASVYVMTKRGVPVDAALAITAGKFATSFALIMGAACVLLALGHGPPIPVWATAAIVATLGFGVLLVGGFAIAAWFPAVGLRVFGRWRVGRETISRMQPFRAAGLRGWLAMTGTHVLYYGAYVGLLLALGAMFDASSVCGLLPIAIVYQAFTYIAPTPGIAEAASGAFFGGLLGNAHAFAVVLLFRALTAYLQIVIGLVYLPVGGMVRAILVKQPATSRAA